jgi:hypothetical protein
MISSTDSIKVQLPDAWFDEKLQGRVSYRIQFLTLLAGLSVGDDVNIVFEVPQPTNGNEVKQYLGGATITGQEADGTLVIKGVGDLREVEE